MLKVNAAAASDTTHTHEEKVQKCVLQTVGA